MDKNLKIFMTIGVALGGVYVLSEMFKSKATTPAKENPQTPSDEPERTSMFTASDDFFSKFTAGDEFFSYTANEGDFFNINGKPLPPHVPARPKRKGKKKGYLKDIDIPSPLKK